MNNSRVKAIGRYQLERPDHRHVYTIRVIDGMYIYRWYNPTPSSLARINALMKKEALQTYHGKNYSVVTRKTGETR